MSDRTPTAARPHQQNDAHFYSVEGEPRYEIQGKTTGKPRPVTIRDARENNWVPSVTTVLKLLHKEALMNWRIEQSVLACLTTPRLANEKDDEFVYRVLHVEQQQDQEASLARDKGTEIHAALEAYFTGVELDPTIKAWVLPPAEALNAYGKLVASEKILVGDGYAGKTDLILELPECWWVWDYKSTKKLPDPKKGGAWPDHRLQLSAYAQAYEDLLATAGATVKPIRTGNLYISSVTPGQFVICEHEDWHTTFFEGFAPLVSHWQWANKYRPKQDNAAPRIDRAKIETARITAQESVEKSEPEAAAAKAPAAPQPTAPVPMQLASGKHVVWTPGVQVRQ